MKTTFYKAEDRGYANHGWLEARHSFSFAGWFNPDKINFGALRVLNDDIIAPGAGFPQHPHNDMEIITIPLSGVLEHKDNLGNASQLKAGQIQVMSAGTGVLHSEYNASETQELKLFQIWIFPDKESVEPRYDEMNIPELVPNELQVLVSPKEESSNSLWINQNAWISISQLDANSTLNYKLNDQNNGLYVMLINGNVNVAGLELSKRDAVGIENISSINISSSSDSKLLFIETPMVF